MTRRSCQNRYDLPLNLPDTPLKVQLLLLIKQCTYYFTLLLMAGRKATFFSVWARKQGKINLNFDKNGLTTFADEAIFI